MIPNLADYLQKTGGTRSMPVYRDLLADIETPLSAYWKLAHDQTHSFLLESVTGGEQVGRYSVLGVRPSAVLRSKGSEARKITLDGEQKFMLPPGEDPLDLLKREMPPEPLTVTGLPVFPGGAVGMLSYDIVRFFEKLKETTMDDLDLDDMAMMLTSTVVVFDHAKNLLRVVAITDGTEAGYAAAEKEIQWVIDRLAQPLPPLPTAAGEASPVESNLTQTEFEGMVSRIKEYLSAGDGIQMVPSQRFSTDFNGHPITLYRSLRSLNPSPYMFLLRFGDFDLVGASPELLVSLHGDTARVRPIAGTRWRGETPEIDDALAKELLEDEKERAEHIMLVDLGRNDLGRVCEYGSVEVKELMVVERYSHVMHIVSDVTGKLPASSDAYELLRASFPAGTVSGAPKVRAMQIIEELEPTRRGSYAGAVGFISAYGDLDLCIAIRTILLKNGKAYVQAGAGIVHDSVPEKEYIETCNKARASLRAIEMAQTGEGF